MYGVTIGKELADLRAGYPGCHAVVFADLSTGMVLASGTTEKTTQERLDALCQAGHFCLTGSTTCVMNEGLLVDGGQLPKIAWQADRFGTRCFVKVPDPAAEALCIVASDDTPLDHLTADAIELLSRIAGD